MKQLLPFLTYNGQAEEAINWYHKAFPNSQITKLNRYGDWIFGYVKRFPCICLHLGIYHFD